MGRRESLRIEEREIISRELSCKRSARFIGTLLGRHHSTISREIGRNGGSGRYRAVDAQVRCAALRARPKSRRLEASARLYDAVNDGLAQHWSPKQISRRLRVDHPDDETMRISHETEVFSTDWSFGGGEDECCCGDGSDSLGAEADAVQRFPPGLEQGDASFGGGS